LVLAAIRAYRLRDKDAEDVSQIVWLRTRPRDADLLRAEQHQALRDGLAELPVAERQLLLLAAGPPLSYRQISHDLGIPVGSIGPLRARYLRRLRATSALRQFVEPSAAVSAARPR
jgi:DNA-directed RNA polymerase specialized sigma24 family protein